MIAATKLNVELAELDACTCGANVRWDSFEKIPARPRMVAYKAIAEAFQRLHAIGLHTDVPIGCVNSGTRAVLGTYNRETYRPAYISLKTNTFVFWAQKDRTSRVDYSDGRKAVETVIHEVGHALHDESGDLMRYFGQFTFQASLIAETVSLYATTNTAEFVAETFTGLMMGKTYSPEVMALYNVLGGPGPW